MSGLLVPHGCRCRLTGWHIRQGMSGGKWPVGLCTLQVNSPWHLSAKHCFLNTCLFLTVPFRAMLLTS